MSGDSTSIRIKITTWRRLNDRKEPGKSFDDVINEVLDENESGSGEQLVEN